MAKPKFIYVDDGVPRKYEMAEREAVKDPRLMQACNLHDLLLNCVRNAGSAENIPSFVTEMIEKGLWKRVWVRELQKVCEFDTFEQYVAARAPWGFGTTVERLKSICSGDIKALDAIDRVCQRPAGNPNWVPAEDEESEPKNAIFDNVKDSAEVVPVKPPTGNSRENALRRLRKHRPDLHEAVLNGIMTAHAAMLEAGFRKKATPVEQIMKLLKKCSQEEKEQIAEALEKMLE